MCLLKDPGHVSKIPVLLNGTRNCISKQTSHKNQQVMLLQMAEIKIFVAFCSAVIDTYTTTIHNFA